MDSVKNIEGLTVEVLGEAGKEPVLYVDVPSNSGSNFTVLYYGHIDKMPHLDAAGWSEGLSATNPVVRDGKVYGRGTNDDGYNSFFAISAIKYLQEKKLPHPHLILVNETGEESGGDQIVGYLENLQTRIGKVDSIIVMDAGAEDFKTTWICASLRGVAIGTLEIQHLSTPCHSGMATGVVPSTFRIARILLSRIEDEATGNIKLPLANIEIPQKRVDQMYQVAKHLGKECVASVSPLPGSKLLSEDLGECLLGKCWKPGLAITGADGIPPVSQGSNVIRSKTILKLSLRLPPGVSSTQANLLLKEVLEKDPPYGAKVTYTIGGSGDGWAARDFAEKIDKALNESTQGVFGSDVLYVGDGGSIPFCNDLQRLWPEADLIVTGVCAPDGNPHGYDENLDLLYTAKLNAVFASFFNKVA